MLSTERIALQFFILIFFSINGLHSYPRHHLSQGILNELIGQDANSPLMLVVDSNNDEQDLEQEQRKGRQVYNPGHLAAKFTEREYENALFELLRNSLHSYPRHHPSLGNLIELTGQGPNSPLILVVDSNNQDRTLNDEQNLEQEQRKGRQVNNPGHLAAKFSEQEYENALYELLRKSEKMPEKRHTRSSKNQENSFEEECEEEQEEEEEEKEKKPRKLKMFQQTLSTTTLFVNWIACVLLGKEICEF